ncbi:hypothetical protein GOP47_0004023 [Adiantum capillus-veneris]|uniref:Uncharacterized protein n=1 Tax=Adiantum capillus-veneris TaxID=13818 RepID=A0A9D4V7E3_ADICA|nr:hypothetical protein GOP47_0004023 [Adiantum capillus-veneris]
MEDLGDEEEERVPTTLGGRSLREEGAAMEKREQVARGWSRHKNDRKPTATQSNTRLEQLHRFVIHLRSCGLTKHSSLSLRLKRSRTDKPTREIETGNIDDNGDSDGELRLIVPSILSVDVSIT